MATLDQGSFRKFVPLDTRPFSDFNVVSVRSLKEGGTDFIPPLADCLDRWRNGDGNGLLSRAIMLGQAQLPTVAIMLITEELDVQQAPYLYLTHQPTDNLGEKMIELATHSAEIAQTFGTAEPLRSVKTVTLGFKRGAAITPIMITTLGANVSKDTKRGIAEDLDVSNAVAKDATINPDLLKWDPALTLGLMPGLVSPFFEPQFQYSVAAWYYVKDKTPQDVPVEIAVSFIESLLIQRKTFEGLLKVYEGAYLNPGFYRKLASPIV